MSKIPVYYARVIEYELGWGSRPDGFIITLDKTSGDAFASEIESTGNYQSFVRKDTNWKTGLLDEGCYFHEDMKESEHKSLWIGNNIDEYLEV